MAIEDGDLAAAEEYEEQALGIVKELKNPALAAFRHIDFGDAYRKQNLYSQALLRLARAQELAQEANDLTTEALASLMVGTPIARRDWPPRPSRRCSGR